MRKFTQILLLSFCAGFCSFANASPLFEDQSVIDIELTGPTHELIKNKEDRLERPFVFNSDGIEFQIQIRTRGKSRLEICEFPPLRLNFETSRPEATIFSGLDKVKLVTHCFNHGNAEQNLLEEYAAYRIFNLLTDASYRVRLLRITYVDTSGRLDPDARERYGFVIEPIEHLANRVGGTSLQQTGVVLRHLDSRHAALVYIFQYLIGNTDWSLVLANNDDNCCHNGDLVGIDDEINRDIHYLPYDFDHAGLVSAPYAKPNSKLHLRNVRIRRYRGFCTDRQVLQAALRHVKSRREEILEAVRETPGMTQKNAQKAVDYVAQFFDKAGDEEKLLKSFERHCIDA